MTPRFPAATFLILLLLFSVLLADAAGRPEPVPDLSPYPWLYLRGGEPVAETEVLAEVILTGDVMAGRGVAEVRAPLEAVAPWLRAADLVLGNLECVVAEGGTARPGPYRLRAPTGMAAALAAAGFDVLGLANNHALDYGPAALEETAARMEAVGVATVGVGEDTAMAARPLIREVGGLRLAFLAFNAVPDPADVPGEPGWARADWDATASITAVADARMQADAVIVSMHWGYEYDLRPDPAQRAVAAALVDAGAALVVGHHPHVVQGTQAGTGIHGDAFVAYSLGNFLFDQQGDDTRQGLALRVLFDGNGLRAVQALPVWAGPRPRLMRMDEAGESLARVRPGGSVGDRPQQVGGRPERVGFACDAAGCRQVDVARAESTSGLMQAGHIDLTGDGVLEKVRRAGDAVLIYEGGVEVWRTRPEWHVADMALGDPNDDGRAELLLAFSQPEAGGGTQSQPFIVGYRRGSYRVLWGGSGVAQPIHEVELGDVDGDGADELVVLEAAHGGSAVSIWSWHGWGFFHEWRSEPGAYHDLVLAPGTRAEPPTILVALAP